MSQILFFLIATTIWIAAHAYVAWRLIGPSPLSRRGKVGLWIAAGVLALLAPATLLLRFTGIDGDAAVVFNIATYLYMGAFLILFVGSLLRDLGWGAALGLDRALVWILRRKVNAEREGDPRHGIILPADPSRRAFVQNVLNVGMIGTVGSMTALGFHQARKRVEVNRVDVPIEGLPAELEGFRIAQLSDIHIGPTLKADFLEEVVETTMGLEADLIAVTGDLIDGYVGDMGHEVEALRKLKAPHGAYFVTGNHEYYWEAEDWIDHVRDLGLTVLNNEHRLLTFGPSTAMIAGVTDYRAGARLDGHASDPHAAVKGGEAADFKLLLAHQPRSVYEASRAGFDLQLSGHTHGGQFYPWNFFVGLAHPFTAGLGVFEAMKIYVSRGTGYWGPPMRIGVPSEITELRLRRA